LPPGSRATSSRPKPSAADTSRTRITSKDLTLASLVVVGLLQWRFWKGRRDLTILIVGAVQAVFGLVIYIERFHV